MEVIIVLSSTQMDHQWSLLQGLFTQSICELQEVSFSYILLPAALGKKWKEWKITFKREIRKIAYTCEQDLHATLAGSRYSHIVEAISQPSQKILILHSESKKENGLEKEI